MAEAPHGVFLVASNSAVRLGLIRFHELGLALRHDAALLQHFRAKDIQTRQAPLNLCTHNRHLACLQRMEEPHEEFTGHRSDTVRKQAVCHRTVKHRRNGPTVQVPAVSFLLFAKDRFSFHPSCRRPKHKFKPMGVQLTAYQSSVV